MGCCAQALREVPDAGVVTTVTRYDGAVHAFLQMSSFATVGRRTLDQVTGALRRALGPEWSEPSV